MTSQPREHAVPCQRCGIVRTRTGMRPRRMTWHPSALCDEHLAKTNQEGTI